MYRVLLYTVLCILPFLTGGCGTGHKNDSIQGSFTHGVASGDPSREGVLIWTRFEPVDPLDSVDLQWEVSRDMGFQEVLAAGPTIVRSTDDFCTKVYVEGLSPGNTYYYRFRQGEILSKVGRTKTLPKETNKVRLAVVNCGKYEGGFFNVYDAISKMEDIDAVIHLGDYIYEDGGGQKPYLPIIEKTGRKHVPTHDLVSLQDYRTRYGQYRKDTMLQTLHERYPMINIWDDHEFSNNAWQGGVSGKIGDLQGGWDSDKWKERVASALKAYDEWIPIHKKMGEPIYRSFEFGDLLHLAMLDTRLCCRTQQASSIAAVDSIAAYAALLGDEQLDWLETSIVDTKTVWNLIGNQVLVARRYLGEEEDSYISLDQWTGYPKDRDSLLGFIKKHPEENIVITTGNVHDAFHFELLDDPEEKDGKLIAHEFAPGSISSGNTAVKKTRENMLKDSADLVAKNPHLKWFDLVKHSFMVMEFTKDRARVDVYQVSTVYSTDYSLDKVYSYDIQANEGSPRP